MNNNIDSKITGIFNRSYSDNAQQYKDEKLSSNANTIPQNISSMIDFIQGSPSYENVERYIKNAIKAGELEEINPITYRSGDYIVRDILRHNGENYANTLKGLTEKNIRIAPQFVEVVHFDDETILFTKIDGTGGKDLIPIAQGYSMLSDEAKQDAYKDVQRLLKAGLVNNNMLRGDYAWYITPESKKLIIPDWKPLRPIDASEANNILNTVYHTLFRK